MTNKTIDNATIDFDRKKMFDERKVNTVLWNFFDTKNPAREKAWTDLYYEYLERIKKEHSDFYKEIEIIHNILADDKKMRAVFLLFKKIVPTIAPDDRFPLDFLLDSLSDVKKHKDYNKLCVFVQIATQKLKVLEERFNNYKTHDKLLLQRKKYRERAILYPLFETILKKRIGFSKGYKEIIVPTLVEHEEYLIQSIEKCINNLEKPSVSRKRKSASRKRKSVSKRIMIEEYKKILYKIMELYANLKDYREYNKIEDEELAKIQIMKNINKIVALKMNYIRNKFYDWERTVMKEAKENTVNYPNKSESSLNIGLEKEPYVILSSSKIVLPTSYVKSVFWSPILDWAINDYLMEISTPKHNESAMERSVEDELWTIIPK